MCPLSDSSRSISSRQTSSSNRDTANDFGWEGPQSIIEQANTVPLVKIFRRYKIHCNEIDFKIRCPFKSHQNGQESTPSFQFYPQTNSFYCWGCKVGGASSHFVAAMESIEVIKAAKKILSVFQDEVGEVIEDTSLPIDYHERLHLMLRFSESVREFRFTHPKAFEYAENICWIYDQINKNIPNMDNVALKSVVEQLEGYLNAYL